MNNDLISRSELKKSLKSNCDLCHDKNTNWCEHCCPQNDFEDLIDNAPTVDIKDEIAGAYNEGYMCGNKEAEKARPQSSLEKPLYKGVLFVDDFGINKVIEVDENGTVTAERIIPRDTFIEAYNKFIKGE